MKMASIPSLLPKFFWVCVYFVFVVVCFCALPSAGFGSFSAAFCAS